MRLLSAESPVIPNLPEVLGASHSGGGAGGRGGGGGGRGRGDGAGRGGRGHPPPPSTLPHAWHVHAADSPVSEPDEGYDSDGASETSDSSDDTGGASASALDFEGNANRLLCYDNMFPLAHS